MKKEVISRLRQILGAPGVTDDETDLLVYECDALTLFKNKPDVVVFPQTTEQVAQIIRVANEYRIPFVPRGAGTGLSGGAVAMEGGIIIELQRMNRILSIDPDNRIAVVQPGVVNIHISQAVAPARLVLRPGSFKPDGMQHRGERFRKLGRSALFEVRHDDQPRSCN